MLSSGSLIQTRNISASYARLLGVATAMLAITIVALTIGTAKADAAFTIAGWGMTPSTTAAAQHPNVNFHLDPDATKGDQTGDDLKTVKVEFAAGMLANPAAVTPCTTAKYNVDNCPTNTNVASVSVQYKRNGNYSTMTGNMYLITPDANSVATFGMIVRPTGFQKIFLKSSKVGGIATVRTGIDADYGIDVTFENIPRTLTPTTGSAVSVTVSDITVNLFARTNNSSSNPYFTYSPTRCGAASARATSTSYLGVSDVHTASWTLTNCSAVQFNPSFAVQMDNNTSGAQTGLKATVSLTQTPATTQQSHVKNITTTLANGTGLNFPAIAAVGALCTDAQLASDTCPAASQIGTTSVAVPFLPPTMTGKIYLMSRSSMITFGYTLHGSGNTLVVLKGSAAAVDLDADNIADAVRAYLINLPQAPFTSATLDFDAQLINNPAVCGSNASKVVTADIAGWSGASATRTSNYTITGGSCAPETTITSAPPSPTNDNTPTFSFVAIPGAGATFQCSLDGSAYSGCVSPFTTASLTDGNHQFSVRAVTAAGTDPSPATASFAVDTLSPIVNITTPATGALLNTSSVAVAFTRTDASAIASTTCAFDSGTASPCTSPKVYTGIPDGTHTVTVAATDAAGNTAASTVAFTVDTIAPNTTITSTPTNPSSITSASFGFVSNEAGSTFDCSLDATAYAPCTSPKTYTGLVLGTHTFAVRATDQAGNTDATSANFTWSIQVVPPPPNPGCTVSGTSATCVWSTPSGVVTQTCSLDGGPAAACTSPKQLVGLSLGTHTFTVCFNDAAGNTICGSTNFTIAPPLDFNLTCNPSLNSVTCSFVITGGTPPYSATCRLDAGAAAACTSPKSYTGLPQGSHTFTVCVTDASGQTLCKSFNWTPPQPPPPPTIITPTPSQVFNSGDPVTLSFTQGGTPPLVNTCALDGGTATTCTSPKVYIGLATGNHTLTVCVIDATGSSTCSTVPFTVVVVPPPTLTITSAPGPATSNQSPPVSFVATGTPAPTTTCAVDGGAAASCTSPFTPPTLPSPGMHTITICASGAFGVCKTTSTWVDTRAYGSTVTFNKIVNSLTTAAAVNNPAAHPSLQTSTANAGAADTKSLVVTLPHGLVTSIAAVPAGQRCTDAQYGASPAAFACPASSIVGAATGLVAVTDSGTLVSLSGSVYLMTAPSDGSAPARLAFKSSIAAGRGDVVAKGNLGWINNGTNQQLVLDNLPTASSTGVAFHVNSTDVTLNGAVGGAAHPFVTNPSYCGTPATGGTGNFAAFGPSPQNASTNPNGYKGQFNAIITDSTSYGATTATTTAVSPVTGCSNTLPPFDPSVTTTLTNPNAGNSTGMITNISTPADNSTLQRVFIKYPPKLALNYASFGNATAQCPSSSANAASTAGVGNVAFDPASCPATARIGQAKITSPLFDSPIIADIYLTNKSPFPWLGIHVDPSVTYPGRPAGETNPAGLTFNLLVSGAVPTVHPTCSSDAGDPNCGIGTPNCDLDTQVCQNQMTMSAPILPDVPISNLTLNLGRLADGTTEPAGRIGANGITTNNMFVVINGGDNTCGTGIDPNTSGADTGGGLPFTQSVVSQLTPWSRTSSTGVLVSGTSLVTKSQELSTPGCDGQPVPDTTITSSPANPTTLTTASFTFTSTAAGATFECQLDGVAYGACTSPKSYSGLSTGNHTFNVRALDAIGTTDPTPASFNWVVNPTGGTPSISICGPSGPIVTTSVVPICFVISGGTPPYTVTCQIDGGTPVACTSPFNAVLPDGTHTIRICVTDSAGNSSCVIITITVDTTAPETTIVNGPSGITNQTTANFSFTSPDSGVTYACQLDGGGYSACVSPKTYTALVNGSHTFQVRATDSVGNTDPTPASSTWTIDTVAPNTTITSQPLNPTASTVATFTFTSTETPSTFVCQLDATTPVACTSPKAYTGLIAGTHTFSVYAIDSAGNNDPTPATNTWIIDPTPPDTSITSGPNASGTNASFSFTSNKPGSTFACSLDGAAFASCTSPKLYSGLATGNHTFQVRATDTVGNVDPTPASLTWLQGDTLVTVTLTSAPGPSTGSTTPSYTFTTTGSPTSTTCSVDGGAAAPCTSPYTPTLSSPSMHTITVSATNGITSDSKTTSTWVDSRAYGVSVVVNKLANSLTAAADVNKPAAHPSVQTQATMQGAADTKSLDITLPHGLSGSLASIPANQRCTDAQYGATPAAFACPASAALGTGTGTVSVTDSGTPLTVSGTGYLMTAPADGSSPARVAVKVTLPGGRGDVVAQGKVNLINNGTTQQAIADNVPTTTSTGVAFHALSLDVTLDGTIGGAAHPLITNQSYCGTPATGGTGSFAPFGPSPQNASNNPNGYKGQFNSVVGNLTSYSATTATVTVPYTVTGCGPGVPPYAPTFTQTLTTPAAGGSSAAIATVTVPANNSTTQRIFVKEPPKIGPNFGAFGNPTAQCPSATAVSAGVVGVGNQPFDPSSCPATARIGQAIVVTPLLETPVVADIYLINKSPLPWLGIHIDPSITYPGRPAGETNPAGVTINLLSTTATPTVHTTCSSGNGDPNCGIGQSSCDLDTQVCQSQITISAPVLPDLPLSSFTLFLGRLADGTTQPPGRIGVQGITTNDPVTVISSGDNTCASGIDPNTAGADTGGGTAFTQQVSAQFTSWSGTTSTGTQLAGVPQVNVNQTQSTPGC